LFVAVSLPTSSLFYLCGLFGTSLESCIAMIADVGMLSALTGDTPTTPAKLETPSTTRDSTSKLSGPPRVPSATTDAVMSDGDDSCREPYRGEVVPLCLDQGDWLALLVSKYDLASVSETLGRLVVRANAEPPKAKKQIFLMVRCHRCLQHTRGGDKRDYTIELPAHQWLWLDGVRERCSHSSMAKTLRIIVDFYRPLCDADEDFERALLSVAT